MAALDHETTEEKEEVARSGDRSAAQTGAGGLAPDADRDEHTSLDPGDCAPTLLHVCSLAVVGRGFFVQRPYRGCVDRLASSARGSKIMRCALAAPILKTPNHGSPCRRGDSQFEQTL